MSGNPLNNMMGGAMAPNPMMAMFGKMMKGQLPIEQMLQQNPGLQQYWQQAQVMAKGKSPQEGWQMVNQLCKQYGVDFNQMKSMM